MRFVAFVLSLLFPGLGHAARGHWRRGIPLFVVWVAVSATLPWSGLIGLAAWFLLRLGIALDVVRDAGGRFPQWPMFLAAVGFCVGLPVVLRFFWVEAFKIPSGGMIPTMQVGDHIYAWKWVGAPRRGDVIVFEYPREPEKDFIKRVVGIAGDRIEVSHNVLVVNGEPVSRVPVEGKCEFEDYDERLGHWDTKRCTLFTETLEGRSYQTVDALDDYNKDFPGPGEPPYVVPSGHVFVLGDNRNNSHDSRFWGPVSVESVKGRAIAIWWSKGPKGIRWERLGESIR